MSIKFKHFLPVQFTAILVAVIGKKPAQMKSHLMKLKSGLIFLMI